MAISSASLSRSSGSSSLVSSDYDALFGELAVKAAYLPVSTHDVLRIFDQLVVLFSDGFFVHTADSVKIFPDNYTSAELISYIEKIKDCNNIFGDKDYDFIQLSSHLPNPEHREQHVKNLHALQLFLKCHLEKRYGVINEHQSVFALRLNLMNSVLEKYVASQMDRLLDQYNEADPTQKQERQELELQFANVTISSDYDKQFNKLMYQPELVLSENAPKTVSVLSQKEELLQEFLKQLREFDVYASSKSKYDKFFNLAVQLNNAYRGDVLIKLTLDLLEQLSSKEAELTKDDLFKCRLIIYKYLKLYTPEELSKEDDSTLTFYQKTISPLEKIMQSLIEVQVNNASAHVNELKDYMTAIGELDSDKKVQKWFDQMPGSPTINKGYYDVSRLIPAFDEQLKIKSKRVTSQIQKVINGKTVGAVVETGIKKAISSLEDIIKLYIREQIIQAIQDRNIKNEAGARTFLEEITKVDGLLTQLIKKIETCEPKYLDALVLFYKKISHESDYYIDPDFSNQYPNIINMKTKLKETDIKNFSENIDAVKQAITEAVNLSNFYTSLDNQNCFTQRDTDISNMTVATYFANGPAIKNIAYYLTEKNIQSPNHKELLAYLDTIDLQNIQERDRFVEIYCQIFWQEFYKEEFYVGGINYTKNSWSSLQITTTLNGELRKIIQHDINLAERLINKIYLLRAIEEHDTKSFDFTFVEGGSTQNDLIRRDVAMDDLYNAFVYAFACADAKIPLSSDPFKDFNVSASKGPKTGGALSELKQKKNATLKKAKTNLSKAGKDEATKIYQKVNELEKQIPKRNEQELAALLDPQTTSASANAKPKPKPKSNPTPKILTNSYETILKEIKLPVGVDKEKYLSDVYRYKQLLTQEKDVTQQIKTWQNDKATQQQDLSQNFVLFMAQELTTILAQCEQEKIAIKANYSDPKIQKHFDKAVERIQEIEQGISLGS